MCALAARLRPLTEGMWLRHRYGKGSMRRLDMSGWAGKVVYASATYASRGQRKKSVHSLHMSGL